MYEHSSRATVAHVFSQPDASTNEEAPDSHVRTRSGAPDAPSTLPGLPEFDDDDHARTSKRDVYAETIERLRPTIHYLINRCARRAILLGRTTAEDLFQDMSIEVMRAVDRYRPGQASLHTYASACVRGRMLFFTYVYERDGIVGDFCPGKPVRQSWSVDALVTKDGTPFLDTLVSPEPSPEKQYARREACVRVLEGVELLPADERAVIVSKHLTKRLPKGEGQRERQRRGRYQKADREDAALERLRRYLDA